MMFYIFLFLALLGTGVGLFPIPEDIIILSAGVGIQQQLGNVFLVFAVLFAGLLISDYIIFWIGRKYGVRIFNIKFFSSFLQKEKVEKVRKLFDGHGRKLVFSARFVSGLRPVVFFTAGMSAMKPRSFVFIDAAASLIYLPFLIFIGYRFSYDLARLTEDISRIYHMVEIAIILAIVGWFVFRLSRKVLAGIDNNKRIV